MLNLTPAEPLMPEKVIARNDVRLVSYRFFTYDANSEEYFSPYQDAVAMAERVVELEKLLPIWEKISLAPKNESTPIIVGWWEEYTEGPVFVVCSAFWTGQDWMNPAGNSWIYPAPEYFLASKLPLNPPKVGEGVG